jgi:hypothetical protein
VHRAALAGGDIGLRQMAKGMFVSMNLDWPIFEFQFGKPINATGKSGSLPNPGL